LRKYIILLIIFIIIIASLRIKLITATPSTLKVPSQYPTIQAAINAAAPGDTILIEPGIYYERAIVNKTVNVFGTDQTTTIIDGKGKGPILNITATGVAIKNLTIQNAQYYVGIWAEKAAPNTITVTVLNCTFINNYAGITIVRGNRATITKNNCFNNQIGIESSSSTSISITYNSISNTIFYGIYLATQTKTSTVKFNTLTNNKYGIYIHNSHNNTVSLNTIMSTNTSNGYGIRLTMSKNNNIIGNTIRDNYYGIVLWDNATSNHIYHNNFIDNTLQQYHYNTPYEVNIWDTDINPGAQGNYWSDYTGLDNGVGLGRFGEPRVADDGIGDTLTPHQNVDYYPLMHPWSPYPIAYFTYTPEKPHPNEFVTFDATLSAGDIKYYKWNFSDGSPISTEIEPITTHVFTDVGDYNVTLTVITRDGFSNSTSKIVSVIPFRATLDVYTQKTPFSGKGFNQTSDAFAPQELVILYGLVTYNDAPVSDKSVSFNIYDPNGTLYVSRSNITNSEGIAWISFRLENNATFGIYKVLGAVEVAGYIANDTLWFEVGWIINIIAVETVDNMGMQKIDFGKSETVFLNIYLRNIAFTPRNVTLTIVIYDNKSQPIAVSGYQTIVDPGWIALKTLFALMIPEWAFTGPVPAPIYANALTNWPTGSNMGTPYCPEAKVFIIIHP